MPELHVIHGDKAPVTPVARKRARQPRPGPLAECPRCHGREVMETKIGMIQRGNKLVGGTKQYICACCAVIRHERVVVS